MTTNLDALLTELSVTIDDQVREPQRRRRRPGRPKRLTDAELVCVAVAQVLWGRQTATQSTLKLKTILKVLATKDR